MQLIDFFRKAIRSAIKWVALKLHHASHGKLHPNSITIIGSLAHIPIAWEIATGHNILASALLVVFGLFDTLDGELARLQKRSTSRGMLLDASTDRLKETVLYTGVAYALAASGHPQTAAFAAAACGASICVSYVKAKGEAAAALLSSSLSPESLNRMFKDGLLTFELRMVLLIAGLLFHQLALVTALIAVLSGITALQRLIIISKRLRSAEG